MIGLMMVFKVNQDKLSALKKLLLQDSYATLLSSTNPYESFRIRYSEGLVVGYTSGKIVANTPVAAELVSQAIQRLGKDEMGYEVIIGSDEAGKGEWLGPITIAAVALTPEQSNLLIAKGVMDSKMLSTPRILELVGPIKENSLSFHVVRITPERFNSLIKEVKDEGKSLNDILAWGHAKAIESVYKDLMEKRLTGNIKVMIDEFDRLKAERRLKRVLNIKDITLEQRPRAEEETAVAAASILARADWETWVDNEARRLGINLRGLPPSEARKHPQASLFAKVSYLHL
jgi:ribonuclease HIII